MGSDRVFRGLWCSAATHCWCLPLHSAVLMRGLMLPLLVSKYCSADTAAPAHWLLTLVPPSSQQCTLPASHLFPFLPHHRLFTTDLFSQCSLPSTRICVGKPVALTIRLLWSFIDHWTSRLESPESPAESLLEPVCQTSDGDAFWKTSLFCSCHSSIWCEWDRKIEPGGRKAFR